MDHVLPLMFFTFGAFVVKNAEQRQRIAWLGAILSPLKLEKTIETLASGYMRAIAETDPERSGPIWRMLEGTEKQLAQQFERLAIDVQAMSPMQARVSRWAMALPLVNWLLPGVCFDFRLAVKVHAQGVARGVANGAGLARKAQARQLLAELYLFQHTCHWYCRSKSVASARLLVRHQTSHEQTLALVSRATRDAYLELIAP